MIAIRYQFQLWQFDENGFSILSKKLPYWDFTNLWAGSRLAREGHVSWLFDVEAYRAGLRAMFSPLLPNQEWSYPPSILWLGMPLSFLPLPLAYAIWTFGTIAVLALALTPLRLPWQALAAILTSPAVVTSGVFGQNGSLTAALLLGALLTTTRAPILSGLLAGLLTIKPHLGLLIPVVYLATGNWRAFASAATTTMALVAATGLAFGFEVWTGFATVTSPLMARILEAPYPQFYHANAMTFFILGRSIGLGVVASYAYQALFSVFAICAVFWIWRKPDVDLRIKAVLTALFALTATPYGYSYDAVPFSVAVVTLYLSGRPPNRYIFCLLWFFPYFAHLPNYQGIGVGVLAPAGLALYGLLAVKRGDFGGGAPATAAEARLSRPGDSRPSAG
ncbi:glycosyltransferase family 87 protein [Rhizobium sp. FKL33]|uniref:glycosyltransferase family 87 protein n=1 Tax=Rhizobium sp. FKL33 TaxID=2562307 RepID=UPI0014855517|nr:glycosyltransferase family 87 protein [Rhizobium sp. FKL33]